MNYEQFLEHLQAYYGGYRDGTKAGSYVLRYLKKDIREDMLSTLLETVLYYCRLSDYAPGISDIEYSIRKAGEEGKPKIFHKPKNKGEAERIKKHSKEVLSLPESERVEFENEGDLFKMLLSENINNTDPTINQSQLQVIEDTEEYR